MNKNFLIILCIFGVMQAMEEGNLSQQKAEEVVDIPDFRNVPLLHIKKLLSKPKFDDPEADMQKLQAAAIALRLKKLSANDCWHDFCGQMGEPQPGNALILRSIMATKHNAITVLAVTNGAMIGECDDTAIFYAKNCGERGDGERKALPQGLIYNFNDKNTHPVMSPNGKYIFAWLKDEGLVLLACDETGKIRIHGCVPGTSKPDDTAVAFVDDDNFCINCGLGVYRGNVADFVQSGFKALTEIYGHGDTYRPLEEIYTFAPGIIAALAPDRKGIEFLYPDIKGKYVRQCVELESRSGLISSVTTNPAARFLAVQYERDLAVFQFQNGEIVRTDIEITLTEDVIKCAISPSGAYLACLVAHFGEYSVKVFDISKAPDIAYSKYIRGSKPSLTWTHTGIHCAQEIAITTLFFDPIPPMLEKYDERFNKNRGIKREIGDSGKAEKVSKFSE